MAIAFIGGTGLYRLDGLDLEPLDVDTRWGQVRLRRGEIGDQQVLFLARHGETHGTPPHAVNHRANIAALKQAGAEVVVASSAVGTLTGRVPPGSLALLTDFIDLTEGRPRTFFETEVIHLDYTQPYCATVRSALTAAAETAKVDLAERATYICTNGPRFETPAEIRAYSQWGAELVGMTNVPEVVLAREAELCYAAVAIATNYAAGISSQPLTHSEVEEMMAARLLDLGRLLLAFAEAHQPRECACSHALDEYRRRLGRDDFGVV
jgi:5'-methylthioadenosine phosphorylase